MKKRANLATRKKKSKPQSQRSSMRKAKSLKSAARTIRKKIKSPATAIKISPKKTIKRILKRRAVHLAQEVLQRETVAVTSALRFESGGVFVHPQSPTAMELPSGYNEDKICAQVRDPWWIHLYWEVRSRTVEQLKNRLGRDFYGAQTALRIYDITCIRFDGKNAHRYFDININLEKNNWYVDIAEAGRCWCVDIGFKLRDGRFITLACSNSVTTPLAGPSGITDEEWMIPEETFECLYGMGFGLGQSSLPKKGWSDRFRIPAGSGWLFSVSSPRGLPGRGQN